MKAETIVVVVVDVVVDVVDVVVDVNDGDHEPICL